MYKVDRSVPGRGLGHERLTILVGAPTGSQTCAVQMRTWQRDHEKWTGLDWLGQHQQTKTPTHCHPARLPASLHQESPSIAGGLVFPLRRLALRICVQGPCLARSPGSAGSKIQRKVVVVSPSPLTHPSCSRAPFAAQIRWLLRTRYMSGQRRRRGRLGKRVQGF